MERDIKLKNGNLILKNRKKAAKFSAWLEFLYVCVLLSVSYKNHF